jgi:hypothetical protein
LITLTDVDPDDNENMATVIVSLLQKYTREKRTDNRGEPCEESIQFRLYRILNDTDANEAKRTGRRLYANQLERCGASGPYINLREITKRFRTAPGNYVIIPSCYDENIKGEFLLRLYTENPINEGNASILTDHKDQLSKEDIFFSTPKSIDEAFSSWANLLGPNDHSKQAHSSSNNKAHTRSATITPAKYIHEFTLYSAGSTLLDEDRLFEKVDVRRRIKRV